MATRTDAAYSRKLTKEARMTTAHAMIWFVITTVGVVSLLAFGMYEGTHSYALKARRSHRLRHH